MAVLTCRCGAKFRLTDEQIEKFYGKKIKCKKCGRVATVPKSLGDVIEEAITLPEEPEVNIKALEPMSPTEDFIDGAVFYVMVIALWIGVPILSGIMAWKIAEPYYSGFLFCIVFVGVWGVLGSIFSYGGMAILAPLALLIAMAISFVKNLFRS